MSLESSTLSPSAMIDVYRKSSRTEPAKREVFELSEYLDRETDTLIICDWASCLAQIPAVGGMGRIYQLMLLISQHRNL